MTHLQTVMRYKINRVIYENFTNSHETIFQTLVEVFFFYDCCCTVNIHPVYLHFRSYIASIITTYTGRTFLRLQLWMQVTRRDWPWISVRYVSWCYVLIVKQNDLIWITCLIWSLLSVIPKIKTGIILILACYMLIFQAGKELISVVTDMLVTCMWLFKLHPLICIDEW